MIDSTRRPLVVYTHRVPPSGPALLRATCDVIENSSDESPSRAAILERAEYADALCFFVPDVIDVAFIDALPRLRVLAGFGKGFDNVDVAAATARGIWVTNVPNALTEATADLAFGLLLALARNITRGDTFVRTGAPGGWHPTRLLGHSVAGATLGIVGFGAIGQALARRAAGFGMTVLASDPRAIDPARASALNVRAVARDALLKQADIVMLAAPLTVATRRLIDRNALRLMRADALLVNPARGSLVDEAAVADALASGALGGYAADVFAFEDRQFADSSEAIDARLLADRTRTVFTPHLGTAIGGARAELARVQATCILQALAGGRPFGAVNDLATYPGPPAS